jgi:hypothetical protein
MDLPHDQNLIAIKPLLDRHFPVRFGFAKLLGKFLAAKMFEIFL